MNITIDDIRSKGPCYDPVRYLPEGWEGTLIDILSITDCPPEDRIWVVTRFLDDRTNRLFAVWCVREALKLVDNPDPHSVAACDVAERYANGQVTADELDAARAAAGYAARAAAGYAAWYAARADPRQLMIMGSCTYLITDGWVGIQEVEIPYWWEVFSFQALQTWIPAVMR